MALPIGVSNKQADVDWLLNYRGGSFLIKYNKSG